MPCYYFSLSDGNLLIEDIEGTELPGLAAARQEAAMDVQHLRQLRIGGRRGWAGWVVQVRDEAGAVLREAPFTQSAARSKSPHLAPSGARNQAGSRPCRSTS